MKNDSMMEYKNYKGSVTFCPIDKVLYGKIECINDVIMYEAVSAEEITSAFEEAVDDYLATCEELGKNPDKTFSGTFNVRIGPERHKKLFLEKSAIGYSSINQTLNTIIDKYFDDSKPQPHHYHFHTTSEGSINVDVPDWSAMSKTADYKPKQTEH